ncbi:MAG: U32 family peptidase, partial [Firmicutes bacterium]|nr:U32 family peptidase [Bacillota bacterium]
MAPVGEWEALVAAVENGADAVYLGGQLFNARRYAANFGPEEMARAVEYAHIRGVNLYVAVNILIKDTELEEAARYLVSLYELGVDGIIVQDLGLASLARRLVTGLPLHGSTQMTVHNAEGAEYLARLGFERVVLARELSLAEVEEIHRRVPIQLEFFVHGALCFSYSGQCLMSSLIGGRSGNRGMCAQPCRLEYMLVDGQGQPAMDVEKTGNYLLSPRDLNMSEHLPELAGAGVRSFKVEGRMKRPEYVATVIRIYRQVIDRWWAGRGAGSPEDLVSGREKLVSEPPAQVM